jgi:DnaJ-class molecular chaperone
LPYNANIVHAREKELKMSNDFWDEFLEGMEEGARRAAEDSMNMMQSMMQQQMKQMLQQQMQQMMQQGITYQNSQPCPHCNGSGRKKNF